MRAVAADSIDTFDVLRCARCLRDLHRLRRTLLADGLLPVRSRRSEIGDLRAASGVLRPSKRLAGPHLEVEDATCLCQHASTRLA